MKNYNIPIFVPHRGCPFDCVFCNQKHITGQTAEVDENDVRRTIEEYLTTLPKENRFIEAAFFGGSFTGIDIDVQRRLLSAADEYVKSGDIDGIRLSTRPDYISEEILDMLSDYGVTTIELGVQSMDDGVLKCASRGHTAKQVTDAVSLIRKYPFRLGLQMMTHLPGDTDEKSVMTAEKIIALKPDMVRIYPTLVIKDTYLEKMYLSGEYTPHTVDEAVQLCKRLLPMFENAGIPVIRVALAVTEEISPGGSLVAGPFHSAFRELVESAVYCDKIESAVRNGAERIGVNSREVSKAVGNRRANIEKIKALTGKTIKIYGDDNIKRGDIVAS